MKFNVEKNVDFYFLLKWNYGAVKEKMPPILAENLSAILEENIDLTAISESTGTEEDETVSH